MRKQIHHRIYDTDQATKVGEVTDTLYRKNTGEFFLYRRRQFYPMTHDDVKNWINIMKPGFTFEDALTRRR